MKCTLMLIILGNFCSMTKKYFSYLPQKIGFDISCKLSPKGMSKPIFWKKYLERKIAICPAEFAHDIGLIFPENRLWHFMLIVSLGMSKPNFLDKYLARKISVFPPVFAQTVVKLNFGLCWSLYQKVNFNMNGIKCWRKIKYWSGI